MWASCLEDNTTNWLWFPNSRTPIEPISFRTRHWTVRTDQECCISSWEKCSLNLQAVRSSSPAISLFISPLNVSQDGFRFLTLMHLMYIFNHVPSLRKKIFHYFLMHIHTNLFLFYFAPSSRSWSPLAGLGVSATTFIFHIRPLVILATPYNSLSLASLLYFWVLISITITTHNFKLMLHAFSSRFLYFTSST